MKRVLLFLVVLLLAPASTRAGENAFDDACDLIPTRLQADRPLPVSPGTCSGVRPGAPLETPLGFCSMNFLFKGDDGYRYIGTAGHCIIGSDDPLENVTGEKRWSGWTGPWAKDGRGRRIGRFAYAVLKEPRDFALIRLYGSTSASARMCHFGGPTGYFNARSGRHVLQYFGNGLAVGDTIPARTAVAISVRSPNHVYAYGAVAFGDSGAGVIDYATGRAVGVAVTTGFHYGATTDHGLFGITRLSPQVRRAERVMNVDLSLKTGRLKT